MNAWPRTVCPTDDDADGLRYLYPECEELLGCELLGGAEVPPGENDTTFGCARFMPANGEYSIDLYYAPTADANWSNPNNTWYPLPYGRALPATSCVAPFITSLGRTGLYRVALLYYYALLEPLVLLLFAKIVCNLCLRMPWMTRTRKRNEKLQRTAAKRKAEVRRMTEGGQEFAVKRAARATGQGDAAQGVIQQIQAVAVDDGLMVKKKEVGSNFLNRMKANKVSPNEISAPGSAPASAPAAEPPLQLTHNAPAAAPTSAPAPGGDGPAMEALRCNLGASSSAPAPSFAQQVKGMTAEVEGH